MKKNWKKLIVCGLVVGLLTGCGGQDTKAESTETYTEKENLKQAGLGGLTALYDDSVWSYNEEQSSDASIAFVDANESVLGIACSREGFYQHPLDMISMSKQIYSTYEGYEEVEAPKEVEVQGENWQEWIYKYEENGVKTVAMARFYSKNYYAYTMTYVAEESAFESGKNEALKVMNSAVMNVPDNAQAEEKAKEFLVGEWDIGASGYLVMKEDGTYTWYMDSSKDEKNMHKGTYGCDIANSSLGFEEGEGIYFVLFPEALFVEGEEGMTSNVKYDYAISLEQNSDGSYEMVNGTTFAMYTMKKQ